MGSVSIRNCSPWQAMPAQRPVMLDLRSAIADFAAQENPSYVEQLADMRDVGEALVIFTGSEVGGAQA